MSIYRSTNPADFDDIDGIVVSESAPASSILGAQTNTVILVGQFERGPATLTEVGSIGEVHELFGKSDTYLGSIALKNKKFGSLKIVRAVAADAVKALLACASSATTRVTFTAKYFGVYGNSIKVTIAAGTTAGKKYTIEDTSANAVLPAEVYDNIEVAAITSSTFANSKLVVCTVQSTAAEPANQAATALASGVDGTIADTDYQTAIGVTEVEGAGNILFLDDYNATRNGYLKTSAAATQDKMVIMAGAVSESVSSAVTAVGSQRDSDGRCIYAYNWVQTTIAGVATYTSPAAWVASILSQTGPNIDPAFAANTQYLAGVTGLYGTLTRANFISLKNAGIMAFEYDQDIGFKIKSGIVTQIADTAKLTVLRRRMADFLTQSVGRFLKVYQNAVNSLDNRNAVKGAILAFIQQQEQLGLLPKDKEVKTGRAKIVDTDSLNTDLNIGQGYFYILYKQRIYSSMRYIVLQAQIGETVVVQEQE